MRVTDITTTADWLDSLWTFVEIGRPNDRIIYWRGLLALDRSPWRPGMRRLSIPGRDWVDNEVREQLDDTAMAVSFAVWKGWVLPFQRREFEDSCIYYAVRTQAHARNIPRYRERIAA